MIDDAALADFLRGEGLLSDQELDEAKSIGDREGRSLYEVVIEHDFVDEAPVVNFASDQLNVAAVDPLQLDPDPEIVDLVPRPVVTDHEVLPLLHEETGEGVRLVLAMRDPIDMIAMDEIAIYSDVDIRPVLAGPKSLRLAIEKFYDGVDSEADASGGMDPEESAGTSASGLADSAAGRSGGGLDTSNPNSTQSGLITSSVDKETSSPGVGEGSAEEEEEELVLDQAIDEEPLELQESVDPTGDDDISIGAGNVFDPSEEEDSEVEASEVEASEDQDAEADEGETAEEDEEGEAIGRIAVKQIAVPKSEVDKYQSGDDESDAEESTDQTAETIESTGEVEAAVAQIDAEIAASEAEDQKEQQQEEDEPEDRLSALKRRLGRSGTDSSTRRSSNEEENPSAFLDRLEVAADGVDEETRSRLRSCSRTQLLEGAVVALVEQGHLDITDILEAIDE